MKNSRQSKIVMLGFCPSCGNLISRSPPVDVAICGCKSAVEVPLVPYVQVSVKLAKEVLENPAIPIIILPRKRRNKVIPDK